jgi:hypothetical protein
MADSQSAAAAAGAGPEEGAPAVPSSVEFGGKAYKPLADGKYDVIILGTGLKECILSGLLSVKGKKVCVCLGVRDMCSIVWLARLWN